MKKAEVGIAVASLVVGVVAMDMTPDRPFWVACVATFVTMVLLSAGYRSRNKEQEKRQDNLELARHEADLRVLLAREERERAGHTRLGPEHLKAFQKPEAPNGWREIEA